MIAICAPLLAGAKGCETIKEFSGVQPCDVLVSIPTTQETNTYLVENDRPAAVGLGRHKLRLTEHGCEYEGDLKPH